jgi:hypothetical protein
MEQENAQAGLAQRKAEFDASQQNAPISREMLQGQVGAQNQGIDQRAQLFPFVKGQAEANLTGTQMGNQNTAALQPFVQPNASVDLAQKLAALEQQKLQLEQAILAQQYSGPQMAAGVAGANIGNAGQMQDINNRALQQEATQPFYPGAAANAYTRDTLQTEAAANRAPLDLNRAAIDNVAAGAAAANIAGAPEMERKKLNMGMVQSVMAMLEGNPGLASRLDPAILKELTDGLVGLPPVQQRPSEIRTNFLNTAQNDPTAAYDMAYTMTPEQKALLSLTPEVLMQVAQGQVPTEYLQQQGAIPGSPDPGMLQGMLSNFQQLVTGRPDVQMPGWLKFMTTPTAPKQ